MGTIILVAAIPLFLLFYTMKNIKEVFNLLEDKSLVIKSIKAFLLGIICTIIDGI